MSASRMSSLNGFGTDNGFGRWQSHYDDVPSMRVSTISHRTNVMRLEDAAS
jgi:hypothetical protein